MFFRVKDIYNRARLGFALQGVLNAQPVRMNPAASFSILSQVREKDLLMYLLAVKSFCRWHQPARVIVLTDAAFSDRVVRTLRDHVPGVVMEPHVKYRNGSCPHGGTWERLVALITHAQHSFTIQLDSDTVTLGRLDCVADCIASGQAFTLGSMEGRELVAGVVASQRAKAALAKGDRHIQTLSESVLDRFASERTIKYVRGCSGFTGIPRGSVSLDSVVRRAQALGQLVGNRWSEWGTEQFMSNLVIANLESSVVLPHPEYATCPNINEKQTVFAHLAGFCRYSNNNQYARLARVAVGGL